MTRKALYDNHSDLIWSGIQKRKNWTEILEDIGVGSLRGLTQWAWKKGWGVKSLGINKIAYERY